MATIQTENQTALQTVEVKDFMVNNGFTQVFKEVRSNLNGYPYITFITAANQSENIYFSKKLAEKYVAGTAIGKGFFEDILVAEVSNAAGEVRMKLVSRNGESQRLEMSDLF